MQIYILKNLWILNTDDLDNNLYIKEFTHFFNSILN